MTSTTFKPSVVATPGHPYLSRHGTQTLSEREKSVFYQFLEKTGRENTMVELGFQNDDLETEKSIVMSERQTTTLSKVCSLPMAYTGNFSQIIYQLACRQLKLKPLDYVLRALTSSEVIVKSKYCRSEEVLSLSVAIAGNTALRCIHLEDNRLDESCISYLCSALSDNDHVRSVVLSGNTFTVGSMKVLSDMLTATRSLHEVSLPNNHIRDVHSCYISDILLNNTSIHSLDLSYNELGDDSCEVLGLALADNDTIRSLDFSWNCIRQKGIKKLADGLKENVGLRVLKLRMNGLGVEGTGFMAMYLSGNETLISLDISSNRISDLGFELLAKMITKNTTLQHIYLGHNPVSTSGVNKLLSSFYSNKESALRIIDLTGVYLDKVTHDLTENILSERPHVLFEVHGVVNSSTELKSMDVEDVGIIDNDNPLEILRFYVEKTGSRVVDVFKIFDAENKNSITKADLVRGLRKLNVNLTQEQVDSLFSALDSDGSGDINFGELMAGDKEGRNALRKKGIKPKEFKSIQEQKKTQFAELDK